MRNKKFFTTVKLMGAFSMMGAGLLLAPNTYKIQAQTTPVPTETVTPAAIQTADSIQVDGFSYAITGESTVALTNMDNTLNQETLTIPSQVTIQGKTYTVTSVNIEKADHFNKVKNIIVPATITDNFVIKREGLELYEVYYNSGDGCGMSDQEIEECEELWKKYYESYKSELSTKNKNPDTFLLAQTFPNLTDVTFQGSQAPAEMNLEKYIADVENITYHVPDGTREAYEKTINPVKLHISKGYSGVADATLYKSVDVTADIQEASEQTTEKHLFSTSTGRYLVTKEAKNGTGTVALLEATTLKQVTRNKDVAEYTVASTIKNGDATYTLTEFQTGAFDNYELPCSQYMSFVDFGAVFKSPDSVTKLNECSLPNYFGYIFLSADCKELPEYAFELPHDGDTVWQKLVWAPGLESMPEYADISTIVAGEKLKVSSRNTKKITVKNTITGASIVCDDVVTANGKKATLKATFDQKTNEQMYYVPILNYNFNARKNGTMSWSEEGIYYVLAFSPESGNHKIIRVKAKDKTFTKGIFSYAVLSEKNKTVAIRQCKPKTSATTLTIPSYVTYKKKKYKVVEVASPYTQQLSDITDVAQYFLNNKDMPANLKQYTPFIPNTLAKKCKIKKIVLPSTIKNRVILINQLPKLTEVVFNKKTNVTSLKEVFVTAPYNKKMTIKVKKSYVSGVKTNMHLKDGEGVPVLYVNWNGANNKILLKTCAKSVIKGY